MAHPEPTVQAELDVADTIGQLMQFWGFKRPMGRIWTILYLSSEPMTAADLAERLKMSSGGVSMTVSELLKWGAVRKTWKPGERRDYYEAETSVWKLVRRVLRERELRLVREVSEQLCKAEGTLDGAARNDATTAFKRERIDRLAQLAKVGEGLLTTLVAGEAIDPTPIKHVAGGDDYEAEEDSP